MLPLHSMILAYDLPIFVDGWIRSRDGRTEEREKPKKVLLLLIRSRFLHYIRLHRCFLLGQIQNRAGRVPSPVLKTLGFGLVWASLRFSSSCAGPLLLLLTQTQLLLTYRHYTSLCIYNYMSMLGTLCIDAIPIFQNRAGRAPSPVLKTEE